MINYTLIIPHYNLPRLLERLLMTVPQREDLQVIVVDDCSPDEAKIQLKDIEKLFPHVEFYSTGTNGGGGKARNIGLRHAKGKYLLFADADDYFTDGLSAFLDKYKSLDFDILYFNVSMLDESSDNSSNKIINWISKSIETYIKTKNTDCIKYRFTQPWCKIISRRMVEQNNILFEESFISNDVKFSTLIDYFSQNIIVCREEVYVWIRRGKSTSHSLSEERILERLKIDIERHNFLRSKNIKDHKDYLSMLYKVYDSGSQSLKSRAANLMSDLDVNILDIYIFRLKRFIHKAIDR